MPQDIKGYSETQEIKTNPEIFKLNFKSSPADHDLYNPSDIRAEMLSDKH